MTAGPASPADSRTGLKLESGNEIIASVRAEKLIAQPGNADSATALEATIKALPCLGDRSDCLLQMRAQEVRAFLPPTRGPSTGRARAPTLPASEVVIWRPSR